MSIDRKMSTGIPPGIAAFAAYFFPFIGGLVFLALERENEFVRFHSAQSIVFWLCGIPVGLLALIPGIGWLLSLAFVILWVLLMYQAWRERMFELPLISDIAKSQVFGEAWKKRGASGTSSAAAGSDAAGKEERTEEAIQKPSGKAGRKEADGPGGQGKSESDS